MHYRDDVTYRLLPDADWRGTIEASRPIYGEAIEDMRLGVPPGTYTQAVIGTEIEVLHYQLSSDGRLCIDSADVDLPGWHQVATLPAGSAPADVLAWVSGQDFIGRQFWQAA